MPRPPPVIFYLSAGPLLLVIGGISTFILLCTQINASTGRPLHPRDVFFEKVTAVSALQHPLGEVEANNALLDETREKVLLEVFIMSKCPDARDAFDLLVAPAVEKVGGKVDFRVEFIGSTTPTGLSCKHGPPECLGNTLHACAAHLYPTAQSLPFSRCLLDSYRLVPDEKLTLRCAEENGIEFERLNACASDLGSDGGMELVKKSFEKASEGGVRRSATIRVGGVDWCVRDGGEWMDCKVVGDVVWGLVDEVERRWKGE